MNNYDDYDRKLLYRIMNKLDTLSNEIQELKETIKNIDSRVSFIEGRLQQMNSNRSTLELIVKYIILPMLFIIAGLVGIKLVVP